MHMFHFSMSCLCGFCSREEGWSCRQSMLLAGISNELRQHRATKKMGCCLPFLKEHIKIVTINADAPRRHIKGRLSKLSTVWMIFYLLNITLLLCEMYLFQSFPLAFIRGSSMDEPQVFLLRHRVSWPPNIRIMIRDGTWFQLLIGISTEILEFTVSKIGFLLASIIH